MLPVVNKVLVLRATSQFALHSFDLKAEKVTEIFSIPTDKNTLVLEGVLSESNPLAFVEVEDAKQNKIGFFVFNFGAKGELRTSFSYSNTSANGGHFSSQ